MRFRFIRHKDPKRANYILVMDLQHKQVVAELWFEHAMVVSQMYANMAGEDVRKADEFMYGHILGVTYALLYGVHYPKTEVFHGANGQKMLRITDPVSGETQLHDPSTNEASKSIAIEQLVKSGLVTVATKETPVTAVPQVDPKAPA